MSQITYNPSGSLELRGISYSSPNDIGEIDFYVSFPKQQFQLFLNIVDKDTGLREVCELHPIENNYSQTCFRVPVTSSFRFHKATTDMSLTIYYPESGTFTESKIVNVPLTTDRFALNRQTALCAELCSSAKGYYEAIIKALQEVIQKGENDE